MGTENPENIKKCPKCSRALPEHSSDCPIFIRALEVIKKRRAEQRKKEREEAGPEAKTEFKLSPKEEEDVEKKQRMFSSGDGGKEEILETKSERMVSGMVKKEKCKECGFIQGHHNDCSRGKNEFEEFKKIFTGRWVETIEAPQIVIEKKPISPAKIKPEIKEEEKIKLEEKEKAILPAKLEKIKNYLVRDILKISYDFATSDKRIKFMDLIKEMKEKPKSISALLKQSVSETLKGEIKELWTGEQRAKHFEQFGSVIKNGFEKKFKETELFAGEQKEIVCYLIKNMKKELAEVGIEEEGVAPIIKNIIAKYFLTGEDLKNEGRELGLLE